MGKVERILRSDHMYLVVVQVYLQDGKRLHADARFWDLYVKQKYVEREDLTSWPTAHHANEEWSTERVEDEHITYMPYQQGFHTPKLGVRLYLHAACKLGPCGSGSEVNPDCVVEQLSCIWHNTRSSSSRVSQARRIRISTSSKRQPARLCMSTLCWQRLDRNGLPCLWVKKHYGMSRR